MAEFDYPSLCGISARVRESFVVEGKGCCHDSVKEIVDQLFSRERGVFSKMSKERVSSIKQEMSREVSLECMEKAMNTEEIKERIFYKMEAICSQMESKKAK